MAEMKGDQETLAYNELKRAIMEGLYPAGYQVVERTLSELLDMSRTPVRSAIKRLEAEGFLERGTNRRIYVVLPDDRELLDTLYLRMALEGMASRLAARNGTQEDFDKLHQLTRPAGTQDRIASSAQVMDAYRTARQIRPNSPFPPEAAGTYFLMRRDYPTARELFLEALRHAPSRPALHQRLFETERQSGNRDPAQYHLRRMLELFPSNPKYQAIYRENAEP